MSLTNIPVPTQRPYVTHDACRKISQVLARVGDKWTVLVVMALYDGPQRFNEIKRMVGGVSQRMLTLTLRGLERDGMVSRTLFPTIPPRVDYALTPLGRSLAEPVLALGGWARAHLEEIDAARRAFDQRAAGIAVDADADDADDADDA